MIVLVMNLFYTKINSFLKKIKSSVSGFTLLEMVIVISIMAIITAVTIGYNRGSDDRLVLFSNQAKVVGVLQRAKSFALQKKEGDDGGLVCAFGVHFEKPRTMIIFRDEASTPNNGFCKDGFSSMSYDEGEKIEEIELDVDIEFSSLSCGKDSCDVLFSTPYLDVSGAGTIGLGVVDGEEVAEVEVGSGAQVYSK